MVELVRGGRRSGEDGEVGKDSWLASSQTSLNTRGSSLGHTLFEAQEILC